jgi:hypothetical protein
MMGLSIGELVVWGFRRAVCMRRSFCVGLSPCRRTVAPKLKSLHCTPKPSQLSRVNNNYEASEALSLSSRSGPQFVSRCSAWDCPGLGHWGLWSVDVGVVIRKVLKLPQP